MSARPLPRRIIARIIGTAGNALSPILVPRTLRVLRDQLSIERDPEEWVEFAFQFHNTLKLPPGVRNVFSFAPVQVRSEILGLMKLLEDKRPRNILEIGTAQGGTLLLLTRVATSEAKIVSVDLPGRFYGRIGGVPDWRVPLYRAFAKQAQEVHIVRGNSHSPKTLNRITSIFGGDELDFLFIDADHTYDGVRVDFQLYSSLVRSGGLVAFHDILPDYNVRFGQKTSDYSIEVYRLWRELKESHQFVEIVRDWDQDGFGIGVITLQK